MYTGEKIEFKGTKYLYKKVKRFQFYTSDMVFPKKEEKVTMKNVEAEIGSVHFTDTEEEDDAMEDGTSIGTSTHDQDTGVKRFQALNEQEMTDDDSRGELNVARIETSEDSTMTSSTESVVATELDHDSHKVLAST